MLNVATLHTSQEAAALAQCLLWDSQAVEEAVGQRDG